jgi:hypothetical protein
VCSAVADHRKVVEQGGGLVVEVAIDAMAAAELGARFPCDWCPDWPAPATIEAWSLARRGRRRAHTMD